MRADGRMTRRIAKQVSLVGVVLVVLGGRAVGQTSSGSTSKGLDSYGWAPPTNKVPTVTTPDAKASDYFGPSTNQPFNEKTLFPNPPPIPDTPKTQAPEGLPPLPAQEPPVVVPDGSLPIPPPKKLWKGGVEFGLNGSQGNSDVLSLRLGANVDRKSNFNLFHADFLYSLSRQDGETKQNQAFINARDEILFADSQWSLFSALQFEYDQFRAYDLRVGTYAGASYLWYKDKQMLFKTRLGAGAVREVDTAGGSPNRWVPEAVIGGDFNYRFTDRQGIVSGMDVFPNLSQLGQYRVRARAGYEIVIDPSHGMVLRLGVQERYDSNPGNARRNDLNYFVTMLFKF